jgi:hypothetical protein
MEGAATGEPGYMKLPTKGYKFNIRYIPSLKKHLAGVMITVTATHHAMTVITDSI